MIDPRAIARAALARPLQLPVYATNLARFGFGPAEGPSDHVIDALVAIGDVDTIVGRLREHLDAGADHVCVELLTADARTVPADGWRRLAPALTAIS